MSSSDDVDTAEKYSKSKKDKLLIRKRKLEAVKKYRERKKEKLELNRKLIRHNSYDLNENNAAKLSSTSSSSYHPLVKITTTSSSSSEDSSNKSFISFTYDSDAEYSSNSDEYQNDKQLFKDSSNDYNSFIKSILSLMFKHKLSDETIKDFLLLIKKVLPVPNTCPKSVNKIYDAILDNRSKYLQRFFYCKNCLKDMEIEMCNTCKNENIYFFTLDVIYQIKSIINRNNIRENLIKNKMKILGQKLKTCTDGSLYQDYLAKIKYDLTISLCLNTDGAPMINSKGFSLWPVIGKIIELPDNIGESFENLIFIGLWLDNEKPCYKTYMSKCVASILKAINSPDLKSLGIFYVLLFHLKIVKFFLKITTP